MNGTTGNTALAGRNNALVMRLKEAVDTFPIIDENPKELMREALTTIENAIGEINIRLEPYDYTGGQHDGEWGVNCYINGEFFCSGMDEGQCLWQVLNEIYGATVEHDNYTYGA